MAGIAPKLARTRAIWPLKYSLWLALAVLATAGADPVPLQTPFNAPFVDVADGASELAAEEVHEVKAEARSSRDFSRELGDFFDGLGPAAYAQEAPPPDGESDDETKTPS